MSRLANAKTSKLFIGIRGVSVFTELCALALAGVFLSTSHKVAATALPVVNLSGTMSVNKTLSSGKVYLITAQYIVPSGKTLTINAGSIVKFTDYSTYITVKTGGSLKVLGASSSPVIFTSSEDDNWGGDSTGDGDTVGAANSYPTSIQMNGGTANISYAQFNEALNAISSTNGAEVVNNNVKVYDSTFTEVGTGINLAGGAVDIERNIFNAEVGASEYAMSLQNTPDVTGLVLSGTNKNIFNNAGDGVGMIVAVTGATVPTGETWTNDGDSGATLLASNLYVNGTLNLSDKVTYAYGSQANDYGIVDDGTVNIPSGAIIKMDAFYNTKGILVNADGVLQVNGDQSNPVNFTSVNDDTLGGDTLRDGVTVGSPGEYEAALLPCGGSMTISYAHFQYANTAIFQNMNNCGVSGSMTVNNSYFASRYQSIDVANGSLALSGNVFDTQEAPQGFMIITAQGISDLTRIVLSGDNKNTFTGDNYDPKEIELGGVVPAGETWDVTNPGAVIRADDIGVEGTWNFSGILYNPNPWQGYAADIDGTLNIGQGSIIKSTNWRETGGLEVNAGGALNLNGISSSHVIFTSSMDDSVGGDVDWDGDTPGAMGDYGSAITLNGGNAVGDYVDINYPYTGITSLGGNINLEHSTINEATYAMNIEDGNTTFRGAIHGTTHGIYACNWMFSCSVDAAYVDWGTEQGPYPDSGALVCGQVVAIPWSYGGATDFSAHASQILTQPACDSTESPGFELLVNVSNYQDELKNLNIDCSAAFQDACNYITTYKACTQDAWDVAESTTPFSMPSGSPTDDPTGYYAAYLDAGGTYIESQEGETVTGLAFKGGGELVSATSTIATLNGAYDDCLSTAHSNGY